MKDTCTNKLENKKVLKKKAILDAAAKVFAEKGYLDTSIKNITDEASISVGSFYSYFQTKEEVLEQIYIEILDITLKLASDASMNPNDSNSKRFTLSMTSAVWAYVKNKELSKVLLVKSMGINELFEKKRWEVLDKTNAFLREVLVHLKECDSANIQDVDVTSVLLTQSIFGVITYWIDEKLTSDLKNTIFTLCTYHLRAMNIDFKDEEITQCINEVLTSDYEKFLK